MHAIRELLLSVLILVGQAHACQAVLVCLDGKVCATSLSPCGEEGGFSALDQCVTPDECQELSANAADCTSCCKISACPEGSDEDLYKAKPLSPSPMAMIHAASEVPQTAPVLAEKPLERLRSHFLRGPPDTRGSRAPPVLVA